MSPDKDETAGVNKAGNRRIRGTNRLACLDYERRTGQKKADARSMLGPRRSLGERHAGRRPMPSARTRAARTAVLRNLCTAAVLCHLNDVSLQVSKNSSEYLCERQEAFCVQHPTKPHRSDSDVTPYARPRAPSGSRPPRCPKRGSGAKS